MEFKLKLPALDGFKVKIDENFHIVEMPKQNDCEAYHAGSYGAPHLCEAMVMGLCICQKHKEAKEVIQMPRMIDWINEWNIANPDDWFRTHAKRATEFYKSNPELSHYILNGEYNSKVLFEGWESYSVETDEANGINRIKMIGVSSNFIEILFFDSGLVRLCAKTKVFENPNYEDAFIAYPHYLKIK